ncbi:MAG: PVC-type heme-binding CxxCH protein [Luteolibacter sp.]|uniref:PVC-type heme-binding CxxCH protein n=1 Tax=Luteolibacter sp. TaxID=1962973 RepID=UPI003265DF8B
MFRKPTFVSPFRKWLAPVCLALGISFTATAAPNASRVYSSMEMVPALKSDAGFPTETNLQPSPAVLLSKGEPWSESEKACVEAYVNAGGGVVLVHDAILASGLVKGEAKKWSGTLPLFFTPPGREQSISHGISNFDIETEMIHGIEPRKESQILATTWSPNQKHLKGTVPQPYVYGVSPVVWTMEIGKGRVVCIVPGMDAATSGHPAMRTMFSRALAWAGRDAGADRFSNPEDVAKLIYPPGGPLAPKEELAALVTHPDFTPELVAAEPLISKPLNLDWDDHGRLWVIESIEYPEGKQGGGPESMYSLWQRDTLLPKPAAANRPAGDRVSWIEDTDGDGVMDKKHVFADDLDLATSFCFHRDGVIVAQPPEILFLRDTDGDGKSDRREVLYTGLGTFDRHSVLNNLRWGLDGWIYATHGYSSSPKVTSGDGKRDFGAIGSGIVRFKPDGSVIEMVSAKSGNCWGVDITADGELFFTQPTSGDLVMHVPASDRIMAEGRMGSEPSWQVMVHLRPVKPLMSWEEIVENQPNDVIGSFTAACGCAIYEGGSWPKEWTNGYFTAEPTVHIIHHEKLAPSGVTYTAEKTRDEEFSATRDFWSRPIDTRVGPDGQLYVIDFYNQAVLHNDPRGPIHLWNNQASRPDRDHFFGRIIRYRHKEAKTLPPVDLLTLSGRVAALSHPNREVRFRAQRLIEEGDVTAAARMIENASGLAKIHALWIRAAAQMLTPAELLAALDHPDASVRVATARVIAAHPELANPGLIAAIGKRLDNEQDLRVILQLLIAPQADAVLPPGLLVKLQAKSEDKWTRAAIARLARNNPTEVLAAALTAPEPAKQASLAALLFDAHSKDEMKLASMLHALRSSDGLEISLASLASLRKRDLPRGTELTAALEDLAASDNPRLAAAALPLAARNWREQDAAKRLPALIGKIIASSPQEADVFAALATLPVFPDQLSGLLEKKIGLSDESAAPVLDAVLANTSTGVTSLKISLLPSVFATSKARVLESLLGRADSAMALTDALESNRVPFAVAGPQVLARLADHPDEQVRKHAAPTIERFRGAVEAKDAVIARLLPQVMAPGDVAAGKQLFAACAVCHTFRGEGALIGPVLEGMGVHGAETLLTHIVDPNREVEPSYHVWNVATRNGQIQSGFLSRETAGSLFIKNAGGEVEIPRDSIVSKTDTGRSLMPEGFEGLGGEGLRDLLAYLRSGEQRFHTVSFGKAATADGSKGVYQANNISTDRVGLKNYGLVEERGIPFQLQDPATASGGKNVIVLKGGMNQNAVSQTMPRQVEIPVNLAAGRLHLLGAVAGWGFPAVQERKPLLTITVSYTDSTSEDLVFSNGIDIADHAGPIDVPGSARTDLTSHGQIRYLWRDLKKPGATIAKLVLSSADTSPAPMVAAITLESSAKDGSMHTPPAEGGPALSR